MQRHPAASLALAGSLAAAALFVLLSLQGLPAAGADVRPSAMNGTCPPNDPMPAGCCPAYYPPNCCPGFAPPNHCCGTKYNPSGDPADCCDPANPVFDLKACLCLKRPELRPLCDALPTPQPGAPPELSVARKPAAAPALPAAA